MTTTAGATATKAGSTTLVLDAHVPGARARVTKRDGFVFNRGLHALYKRGAGWEVLRSLGIEPEGSSPPAVVGGSAGAILSAGSTVEQVMAVTSKDGVIASVYFVGNPDKLTSVGRPGFIE
jgi:phytoene dehydrogenase-like protein